MERRGRSNDKTQKKKAPGLSHGRDVRENERRKGKKTGEEIGKIVGGQVYIVNSLCPTSSSRRQPAAGRGCFLPSNSTISAEAETVLNAKTKTNLFIYDG